MSCSGILEVEMIVILQLCQAPRDQNIGDDEAPAAVRDRSGDS